MHPTVPPKKTQTKPPISPLLQRAIKSHYPWAGLLRHNSHWQPVIELSSAWWLWAAVAEPPALLAEASITGLLHVHSSLAQGSLQGWACLFSRCRWEQYAHTHTRAHNHMSVSGNKNPTTANWNTKARLRAASSRLHVWQHHRITE